MGTVTIPASTGEDYPIYGTLAEATIYLTGSMSAEAVAWRAASVDQKARTLVEAARILNRQAWQGAPTLPFSGTLPTPVGEQELAWPRTGVTITVNDEVVEIADDEIPQPIIDASFEMAASLAKSTKLLTASDASSNIQSLQAGSAAITYFAPVNLGRFPTIIMELIADYLGGGSTSADGHTGSRATGTCGDSSFDPCDEFNLAPRARW